MLKLKEILIPSLFYSPKKIIYRNIEHDYFQKVKVLFAHRNDCSIMRYSKSRLSKLRLSSRGINFLRKT